MLQGTEDATRLLTAKLYHHSLSWLSVRTQVFQEHDSYFEENGVISYIRTRLDILKIEPWHLGGVLPST